MAEERIRCGDHVLHRPSGEEWVVAYADYESGNLAWAGWPDGSARGLGHPTHWMPLPEPPALSAARGTDSPQAPAK